MVSQRDDSREDFIINKDYTEEAENLNPEEYYGNSSEIFRKKPIMPFMIGGIGLLVLVIMFVLILARPNHNVDQEYLQTLEARMQQLEKKIATIGVMDQTLEKIGRQKQELENLGKKLNRLASTVTPQIDQIIKELGALHQKIDQGLASAAPGSKTVKKKQPVATKRTDTSTKYHQVQPGDTLYRISRQYEISIEQLRSYNNLAPNAAIYPGQKLKLNPNVKN